MSFDLLKNIAVSVAKLSVANNNIVMKISEKVFPMARQKTDGSVGDSLRFLLFFFFYRIRVQSLITETYFKLLFSNW